MLSFAVFALIVLLIDLTAYQGLKVLFGETGGITVRLLMRIIFWLVPFLLITSVLYVVYFRPVEPDPRLFNSYYYIIAFAFMFYLPKLFFIAFYVIEEVIFSARRLIKRVKRWFAVEKPGYQSCYRGKFKFMSSLGVGLAIIPFLAIIYGMMIGRFDFRVINKTFEHESIPISFDGFRIVHISDIHIGSFHNYKRQVERAVDLINGQNPDLIVFTGDLVNNFTSELDGFIPVLGRMNAPFGIYSILGNHDYGDYFQWDSEEAKENNLQKMLSAHKEMGFRLLLNEWDILVIDDGRIAIIGVENWGKPPFPQYGDLDKASAGTERFPFRILLTHDPSHWDAEVVNKTDIELTLSGHTHGMQVGIEVGNIRWSPGKLRYPRWGGLYREDSQYLYVNRGLGFIAFPGRIGMPPEITVIELRNPG